MNTAQKGCPQQLRHPRAQSRCRLRQRPDNARFSRILDSMDWLWAGSPFVGSCVCILRAWQQAMLHSRAVVTQQAWGREGCNFWVTRLCENAD